MEDTLALSELNISCDKTNNGKSATTMNKGLMVTTHEGAETSVNQGQVCESGQGGSKTSLEPALAAGPAEVMRKIDGQLGINDLPDEVILSIFSFFSFNQLIEVLPNVCVRWKRLTQDPVLWQDKQYVIKGKSCKWQKCPSCYKVNFRECIHCRWDDTDEKIMRTTSMAPQLRSLLVTYDTESYIIRETCRKLPNLTELLLSAPRDMSYSLLEHIVESCPKIQSLTIANHLMADRRYAEIVSRLKQLKTLDIFYQRDDVGHIQLRILGDKCQQLERIKIGADVTSIHELEWEGPRSSRDLCLLEDLEYFLRAKKDKLIAISLRWMKLGRRCIFPLLTLCASSLRKLKICRYDVLSSEEEEEALVALGQLHNLTDLYIHRLTPAQSHLISLPFQSGRLSLLQRLCLPSAFSLLDDTVITISRGCPDLHEFRICYARSITDEALKELHRLKNLKVLDISGCASLRGTAIAHVARIPGLYSLILQDMPDLKLLLPGLRHILDMKDMRFLDLLQSKNIRAVPFSEFPDRLKYLRLLHITSTQKAIKRNNMTFDKLQSKMPELRVFNVLRISDESPPV